MIVAITDIVKLYGPIKCQKKLLLFSHNHRLVGIYNYYTIIEQEKTIFYHHLIYKFSFTALDLQLLKPNKFFFYQH